MSCRRLRGYHPSSGEVGLWLSKPGYDCINDDRTDRNKFFISTSFTDRKPFRIIAAGITNTNTPIYLPSSLGGLGGDPILNFRPMVDANTERRNNYYGTENDGLGNSYSGSELYSRLIDGNPAYFLVAITGGSGTGILVRYLVALY